MTTTTGPDRAAEHPAPLRVLALAAGLGTPSSTRMLADQLSSASAAALRADGAEVEVHTVELREYAREITDAMLSHVPGPHLARLIEEIKQADAVIAVTPIFNTGASGLFKSLIDVVEPRVWAGRPVLLGATAGSARHSLALEYAIRPMFVYLKATIVPTAVFAASSDFGAVSADEADAAPLASRSRRAAAELATLVLGLRGQDAASDRDADGAEEDALEAEGADATEDATALDTEFSDFVPMGSLLHHD